MNLIDYHRGRNTRRRDGAKGKSEKEH